MDSGASTHITNNSANLDHASQTYGKDEVTVGNGEKLKTLHTGFTLLPSNHQNLYLKNVLRTLHITKNLMSVSKLIADNNVLIEFGSYGCHIKDKSTGTILLKGKLRDGLYEFQNPRQRNYADVADSHSVFSVSKNTESNKRIWHVRLGHPSDKVLSQVPRECNVKINANEDFFCEPCQYGKNNALPFKLLNSRASHPLELIHSYLGSISSTIN